MAGEGGQTFVSLQLGHSLLVAPAENNIKNNILSFREYIHYYKGYNYWEGGEHAFWITLYGCMRLNVYMDAIISI